jgi:hypothetical protein
MMARRVRRYSKAQIMEMVANEIVNQDEKWGEQNHDRCYWLAIAGEEFGEACKAAIAPDADPAEFLIELVDLAAVCVNAIHCDLRHRADAWEATQ